VAGTRVFPNALELRAAAARTSLEQIDRDHGAALSKLRPLLLHIRQNLFSSGLNVQALKRACGVRDNSVSTAFGRAIGMPPRPYIEARRLETAERLLRDTALPVHQIGELVGFSSEAVFYRAFRRWRGEAPREFRQRAQTGSEPKGAEGLRPEAVQRALRRRASTDETEALIAGLTAVARGRQEQLAASCSSSTKRSSQGADALWATLRPLDPQSQRQRIRALRHLRTDLAELLFEKSRTEGRDNRQYGVHIAELAVECLYPGGRALDDVDPAELATLRAQAWAWLANAHRLAADLLEAERTVGVACRTLPESAPGEKAAEVLELLSTLRYSQGRLDEALEAVEQAESRIKDLRLPVQSARLLTQRATLALDLGRPEETIRDATAALWLLTREPHAYLELANYHRLIAAFLQVDRFRDAVSLIPAGRRLANEVGGGYPGRQQGWLEGLVFLALSAFPEAQEALDLALDEFMNAGESFTAALITLDLAVLYAEGGDTAKALQACSRALPLLQAFGAHREAMRAVKILHDLTNRRVLQKEQLRDLRNRLDRTKNFYTAHSR